MYNREDATGTVAQLGERRTEDAEAAGSSPASPTISFPVVSSVDPVKRLCLNTV